MADSGDSLPELTRALRALGSRRGVTGRRAAAADQQSRFFATLVDARRAAASAQDTDQLLDAFDAAGLRHAFDSMLAAFAQELYPEYASAARAVEAQLAEAVEPLMRAIDALAAARVSIAGGSPTAAWSAAVQHVFECADRAWMAVDPVLERATVERFTPPVSRARGRSRKSG